MEFRELNYLLTLAHYRNITRAAEKLYISQSALSHYIKNIEEELGVQLFDRSTSPLSLTQAGQCYMESARKILMEQERFHKELRDITEHMTGKLSVGTSRERASYMMPRILPVFSEKYPGIKVEVVTDSGQVLFEMLREGRVDLLLLPSFGQDDLHGLQNTCVYKEELVLAAKAGTVSPEDRIPGYHAINSRTLNSKPFFLLFPAHVIRSFCNRYFKNNKIHPEISMEFSSNISCLRMAASGMGYAIIPYLTTKLANPGGEIELFSLGAEPETWDIDLFYRKGAYLGRPELDFIEITKDCFSHELL